MRHAIALAVGVASAAVAVYATSFIAWREQWLLYAAGGAAFAVGAAAVLRAKR